MADINSALAGSRKAVDELLAKAEQNGSAWTTPRAPGKWSPSQIVEHVARALEESAKAAHGETTLFPKLPVPLRPVVRLLLFKRVLRKGAFPKAKTNKPMDPASGPPTLTEGRARLERAHDRFDEACRKLSASGRPLSSTVFGNVTVEDYVRFMEFHTHHHRRQIPGGR